MARSRIALWLDKRLDIEDEVKGLLFKPLKGGAKYIFSLGFLNLFLFINQVLTGMFLMVYYVPAPDHAYDAVRFIQNEASYGNIVRGLHFWGASAMIVSVMLHVIRVYIFGAYKKPREIMWLTGSLIFLIVFGFAFTGYLLPWDQKAYWATVVGTNIAGSAPLIGGAILELLRGGPELGAVTLARFYGIHVWVLPALLVPLVVVHFFAVVRQGIAASPRRKPLVAAIRGESRRDAYQREYAAEKAAGRPFWHALMKDAIVSIVLLGGIFVL